MKGFKSTSTNPYTYTQSGVWKKGQYTFQAVVLSDSGYAFAFQRSDTTWQTVDLSWQVKAGSYSKIQWTFTLEADAVAFRLIANTVTGETIVVQPMLEKGTNGSTPIAHEEDLRGMDGDNHEFIFTRNDTGIAPPTPLSIQEDDYTPIDDSVEPPVIWTDNPQGVTKELPFEFVSMREKKNGVWLDFSPPSLWAKWGEDGLSVNLLVEGHYKSHWEGTTKVVEIVGGVDVGGSEVVKVSAVFRKGEENIAATVSQSRGFQWYVNGVHLTSFDNQPFITLDETYGDGFADYVVLSYLVNSIREEERREIINISEGMDGKSVEFIFKLSPGELSVPTVPPSSDPNFQDDDYHGQGTANEWEDDPVSPTWISPITWVSERKKVNGVWGAFSQPSIWAKYAQDGEDGKDGKDGEDGKDAVAPIIIDGFWAFWDDALQDYVKSSFSAVGDDGHSPYVEGGYWYQWNSSTGQYENTNIEAKGDKGDPGDDAKSILLTATSTQIHVDKNGSTPASITVTASSDTITPDSWEFSVDGASFSTNVPSCVTMTSFTLLSIDTASADFKTLSIRSSNIASGVSSVITINRAGGAPYIDEITETWWTWDEAEGAYTDTGMSPVGSDGRIPYPAGFWEAKTYTRDANYAPYVQHTTAVYLLVEDSALSTDVPGTSNKWKALNNWQAVFVDSLVAAFAKIGGAVFTGDTTETSSGIRGRLISETGVKSGFDNVNYSEYVGDSGSWIPKMMLDFLTGAAYFGAKKIMFNPDGSGYLANQKVSWNANGDTDYQGTLTGVSGSFKTLNCVNEYGNTVGTIRFGTDGRIWFENCSISHQSATGPFLGSDMWVRGAFGAFGKTAIRILGSYGYVYAKGLGGSSEYLTLISKTDTDGNTYYDIPIYSPTTQSSGCPIDIVVINHSYSSAMNYNLQYIPGKTVVVVNSNNVNSNVYVYCNGVRKQLMGGEAATFVCVGSFQSPDNSSRVGRGWFMSGKVDNDWT